MYQQQQYHTSSYRGSQPGHDQYLRSDSSQPSSFGAQQQTVTSQYRGFQKPFQPTGMVQSFYRGNQPGHDQYLRSDSSQPSNIHMQSQMNQGSFASQSYQMSNYKGNQYGHDRYLRSDSSQPSQTQGMQGSAYQGRSFGF